MTHLTIDVIELGTARDGGIISFGRIFGCAHAWDDDWPFNRNRALGNGKRVFHLTIRWLDFHKGRPVDFDNVKRKKQDHSKGQAGCNEDHEQALNDNAETSAHK